VYAVTGGKQGLLHILVDEWTEAPEVAEAYRDIAGHDDAEAITTTVASLTRRMHGDWGDVMRIVRDCTLRPCGSANWTHSRPV
jgi:hypothetical protein